MPRSRRELLIGRLGLPGQVGKESNTAYDGTQYTMYYAPQLSLSLASVLPPVSI